MLNNYRSTDKELYDNKMQNIPSHNREIRMLFCAADKLNTITTDSDTFQIMSYEDIETPDGWKNVKQLQVGDKIIVDDRVEIVYTIEHKGDYYFVKTTTSQGGDVNEES